MAAFPTRAPDVFYEHWATIRADPTNVTRTIVADDEVVGDIVSWLDHGSRQVGYWIGREHWGKGFATAALRLLLEEITDRPVTAHIVPANIGSQRVRREMRVRPGRRGSRRRRRPRGDLPSRVVAQRDLTGLLPYRCAS